MKRAEVLGNAAIIGGLLTSGGAIVDAVRNRAEILRQEQVVQSLREKFGITTECEGGVFSQGTGAACYDVVPSAESKEDEKNIFLQYEKDLHKQNVTDPSRGTNDGFIAVAGMLTTALGVTSKFK